jgi:4-hydroxybenzoate polyprenyltransferase
MQPAVESAVRRPPPEQPSPPVGGLRSLSCLLSCIRFDEVLILQGSPLLGVVFSTGRRAGESVGDLAIFAVASFCLSAHVFALNDWSGMGADSRDTNRATDVFMSNGIGQKGIRNLWIILLALSLLLLSLTGSRPLILGLAIAGLSALYSAPAFHLKGVPLLNSALHLIGGLLHFLLGYSLFRPVDGRSLEIGCFFALVFAAGHLTHEARDCDADLLNGIRTNAVTFGKAGSFAAGIVLFTIADALLVVLAARGIVPRALALVAALYAVHLYWSLRTLRAGLNFESIWRLQMRYRALYAIIGLMMVVTVLE